jgi:hypothetical protein
VIALRTDCLVLRLAEGWGTPWTAGTVPTELLGDSAATVDPDFLSHATNAVLHYFKHELGCESVTAPEFTRAMKKVLQGLAWESPVSMSVAPPRRIVESDLCRLARESGDAGELAFFPLLREELRRQVMRGPEVLRFQGLRPCVKEILGVRKWNSKCGGLADQIVVFLRQCLSAEAQPFACALVIE